VISSRLKTTVGESTLGPRRPDSAGSPLTVVGEYERGLAKLVPSSVKHKVKKDRGR